MGENMLWRGGKKVLSILVLVSFLSALASAQPSPSTEAKVLIYERELSTLLSNITKLQQLNEKQTLQLNASNEAMLSLRQQLSDLNLQLAVLETEVGNLKTQLQQSQLDLTTLEGQLRRAEDSYKSLYDSFLLYQKEADKQIRKLKKEVFWLKILAFFGWGTAAGFGVWGLVEHFGK